MMLSWLVVLAAGCGSGPVQLDTPRTKDTVPTTATTATGTGSAGTTDASDTSDTPWTPGDLTDTAIEPATCASWCTCVVAACDRFPQVDDVATCLARCDQIEPLELECWAAYCARAESLPVERRRHACEHAVGLFGLEECTGV